MALKSLRAFYDEMHGLNEAGVTEHQREVIISSTKVFDSLDSLSNKL